VLWDGRYWVKGKAVNFLNEAKDFAPLKYPFEECFPDQQIIEVGRNGYRSPVVVPVWVLTRGATRGAAGLVAC
jgi:hypothetical protein